MSSYTLNIEITAKQVMRFTGSRYQLCLAFGVTTSDKTSYNVIALASEVAQKVTIQWTDEYSIAASRDRFKRGAQFTASTEPVVIKLGQSYTQPATFENGSITSDPSAPSTGFSFINKANEAAAIVYRRINGVQSPMYINERAPLRPGREDLVPSQKVTIWFASNASASTMSSLHQAFMQEIDFSGKTEVSAKYDDWGKWTLT